VPRRLLLLLRTVAKIASVLSCGTDAKPVLSRRNPTRRSPASRPDTGSCDDRPVSGPAPVEGDFWTLENPELRVRGQFSAEVGKKPEVTLAARLVADPPPRAVTKPGDLAAAIAAHAAGSVAAFQPITLQGQLDTGELVTPSERPELRAR
jgi:hypothetical protein